MPATVTRPAPVAPPPPIPKREVREAVKRVLTLSKSFAAMPAARQQQIARDTALIADYLASPEGIPGNHIPGGLAAPSVARALDDATPPEPPAQESYDQARKAVTEVGGKFQASAAEAGAKVAGQFMKGEVTFDELIVRLNRVAQTGSLEGNNSTAG